jgi:hypothetical protein
MTVIKFTVFLKVYDSQRFFIEFLYFQYYVEFGGERYVDLGLGTHRVKCRVHKKFR